MTMVDLSFLTRIIDVAELLQFLNSISSGIVSIGENF